MRLSRFLNVLRENLTEATDWHRVKVRNKTVEVAENPSENELAGLIRSSKRKSARLAKASDGTVYAWDANDAIHQDIERALTFSADAVGAVHLNRGSFVFIGRAGVDWLSTKRLYERVDTIEAGNEEFEYWTDPSAAEISAAIEYSQTRTLRGVYMAGHSYWWDAYNTTHDWGIDALHDNGVQFNPASSGIGPGLADAYMVISATADGMSRADGDPRGAKLVGPYLLQWRRYRRNDPEQPQDGPFAAMLRGLNRMKPRTGQISEGFVTVEEARLANLFQKLSTINRSEGHAAAEQAWIGGIADHGDRDAGYHIQNMPGYFGYRSQIEDVIRKYLGDSFTVYRWAHPDQVKEWKSTSDIGPIAVSLSRGYAEKYQRFAGHDKRPGVLLQLLVRPEDVVMVGNPSEAELVIDSANVQPNDIKEVPA